MQNTLVGGNCFQVSNITALGDPLSRGTFSNGLSNIGLSQGIVLATGDVNILKGPNTKEDANGGFGNNTPTIPTWMFSAPATNGTAPV
ncbi:MAG: choice-of-anchor L domain-containing protein [Lewinellaceae bacterium]|nr:choice-of-anchor L domain-containing protein [Lewinellaceae bacterium]